MLGKWSKKILSGQKDLGNIKRGRNKRQHGGGIHKQKRPLHEKDFFIRGGKKIKTQS